MGLEGGTGHLSASRAQRLPSPRLPAAIPLPPFPAAALPKPGSPHDRPMRRAKSRRGPCEPMLRGNQLKPGVSGRAPPDWAERSPRLLPGAQADIGSAPDVGDLGNQIGAGASECPERDPEGSTRQKAEFGSVPLSECPVPPWRIPTGGRGLGYARGPLTRDWPFPCGWRVPVAGGAGGLAGAAASAQTKARGTPRPDPWTRPGPEARAPSALSLLCSPQTSFLPKSELGSGFPWPVGSALKRIWFPGGNKLSKGELVELSWKVTFVADRKVEPQSVMAPDSPGDPLVLALGMRSYLLQVP